MLPIGFFRGASRVIGPVRPDIDATDEHGDARNLIRPAWSMGRTAKVEKATRIHVVNDRGKSEIADRSNPRRVSSQVLACVDVARSRNDRAQDASLVRVSIEMRGGRRRI